MKKEQKNEFVCPVCKKKRLRGSYVKPIDGLYKGWNIKICKSSDCLAKAILGDFSNENYESYLFTEPSDHLSDHLMDAYRYIIMPKSEE